MSDRKTKYTTISIPRELYHRVIHDMTDVVKAADRLGYWGLTTVEHHLHSEGYELSPSPTALNAYWAAHVQHLRVGQHQGQRHVLRRQP